MDRRKFLIGMGSVAAGGAAAIGTGAFTAVNATRSIDVEVAGDNQAYLTLDAAPSPYAEQDNGQLELRFDGSTSGQNGDGLNPNADTLFSDVFRVENKGTNDIRLQIGETNAVTTDLPNGPMAMFYSSDSLTGTGSSPELDANPFASSPTANYFNSANINNQDLAPGDDFYIHVGFYLNNETETLGSSASTSASDIPSSLGIYADATSANAGGT